MKPKQKTLFLFVNPVRDSRKIKIYAAKHIAEEAAKRRIRSRIILYEKSGRFLKTGVPDAAIFRGTMHRKKYNALRSTLVRRFSERGTRVLNARSFLAWEDFGKWTQYIVMKKFRLSCVPTRRVEKSSPRRFPIVVKPSHGSHGIGVQKINNRKEWEQFLSSRGSREYIIQPVMREGEDIRVIILEGKILGAIVRKAAEGKFVANFSQGGSVRPYDIFSDLEAKTLALAAAKLFQTDYAGIDLILDRRGRWRVLEVNRSAQFEGFEQARPKSMSPKPSFPFSSNDSRFSKNLTLKGWFFRYGNSLSACHQAST